MKTRSIIDTESELEGVVSALIRVLNIEDTAFSRHHVKRAIVDGQIRTGARVQSNNAVAMERPWTDALPLPAGEARANGAQPQV